jgi:hypothetical protein
MDSEPEDLHILIDKVNSDDSLVITETHETKDETPPSSMWKRLRRNMLSCSDSIMKFGAALSRSVLLQVQSFLV